MLDTPGESVGVVPVVNQLGAFVAHTDGGDFLIEAIDANEKPVNSGVSATFDGDKVTFGGATTTDFSGCKFQFVRLASTAALSLVKTLSQGGIAELMLPATA